MEKKLIDLYFELQLIKIFRIDTVKIVVSYIILERV